MRLFIAFDIDENIRDNLQPARNFFSGCATCLKTVSAENCHVTVRFLGECGVGQSDDVRRGFSELRPGTGPVEYTAVGLGGFPNIARAAVLYCGIRSDMEKLRSIHGMIENFVRLLGFPPENRPFTPHVTLARIRKGMKITSRIIDFCRENADREFGKSTFNEIVLYSSSLTPRGSVYTRLSSVPL